jgi:hypothetical protein
MWIVRDKVDVIEEQSLMRAGRYKSGSMKSLLFCCLLFCVSLLSSSSIYAQTNRAIRAKESKAIPAGEVTVLINQQLLNSVLEAMFTYSEGTSIPLSKATPINEDSNENQASASSSCPSELVLMPQVGNVRTEVKFTDGKISAPIAFKGSYSLVLIGCINFEGWADTTIDLVFDRSQQSLIARVKVNKIHLENIPSLISSNLIDLIQDAIDARANPVTLLRTDQLSPSIPMPKGKSSNLQLRAKEIRPEVIQDAIKIHIVYEVIRRG